MNSRLMQSLREEKGYTYGINAGVLAGGAVSERRIGTSVETSVTGPAVEDIFAVAAAFAASGPSADELKDAITSKVAVRAVAAPDRPATSSPSCSPLSRTSCPTPGSGRNMPRLHATTLDSVVAAAADWNAPAFTLVACGDAATIVPGARSPRPRRRLRRHYLVLTI